MDMKTAKGIVQTCAFLFFLFAILFLVYSVVIIASGDHMFGGSVGLILGVIGLLAAGGLTYGGIGLWKRRASARKSALVLFFLLAVLGLLLSMRYSGSSESELITFVLPGVATLVLSLLALYLLGFHKDVKAVFSVGERVL